MTSNSLRPGWNRQGFQPPPPADNTFAAVEQQQSEHRPGGTNSRSGNAPPPAKGRSLADLARGNPTRPRSGSTAGITAATNTTTATGGVPPLATNTTAAAPAAAAAAPAPTVPQMVGPRYTREKLLSLRVANGQPPEAIQLLIEEIKYEEPQDPVCWDTFDSDEIWNTKRKVDQQQQRLPARRDSSFAASRWQRGVALPVNPEKRTSISTKDAASADELWDDPQAEEKDTSDVFDFEKMAENSRKLEEEMRGGPSRSRSSSTADEPTLAGNLEGGTAAAAAIAVVDPNRPLATAGTTIRSGSGDDVNVFEDFDEPVAPPPQMMIRAATEDQSASSRLMAMIGVHKEEQPPPTPPIVTHDSFGEEPTKEEVPQPAASFVSVPSVPTSDTPGIVVIESKTPPVEPKPVVAVPALSWGLPGASDLSSTTSIPLNPWGGLGAALPLQTQIAEQQRLEEEKKRAALEEQERMRRREQQERLMKEQQQREAQVELVLMERVSSILEASWGRADLRSILSTLHAEDARVIGLLNSVDSLRALLFRHPRRIAIRPDPGMGTEIAILLLTNMQWRASEQQESHLAVPHQQQQQQQQHRAAPKPQVIPAVNPTLPWFYSDPSKNIQGPFRGQEMRQWLEAGYFKGDLPISQNPKGPFLSLSLFFPNLAEAFKLSPYQVEEEAEAAAERKEAEMREARLRQQREAERERMENERREAERREHERREAERREAERREALLQQQQAKAAAAVPLEPRKVQNGGDSDSAAKLKMMLGLGVVESSSGEAKGPVATSKAQVAPAPLNATYPKKATETPTQKPHNNTTTQTTANNNKEKPAWGGAAQPTARKSMSEIQQEEARAAAVAAMNRSANSGSNGWANVAASRSSSMTANTSWNANKQNHQRVVPTTTAAVAAVPVVAPRQPTRTMSMQPQPPPRKQPMRSQSEMEAPTGDAFGAKMSPAFEQWAKDQMKRINGTDDLTLVSFCMTLQDPDEIRQYLSAYLGANSIVNTFASEFINRKNDDWESTARKGRKKKTTP